MAGGRRGRLATLVNKRIWLVRAVSQVIARDADDSGLHSLWVTDRTMAGMPWLDALTVAGLTQFFGTVAGMRHEFLRTYRTGDTETMEAAVTYTRQDGTQVTLPGMAICVRHHDQIRESRSYIDIGPLFQ
jgi:hypothetical protein